MTGAPSYWRVSPHIRYRRDVFHHSAPVYPWQYEQAGRGMSDQKFISIRGAREHNLKNVDLDLPRDKLIVMTGLSGSGKSSLAFDTIYAEGQRRYVESLSAYARQFLEMMQKPDVDQIDGLSPPFPSNRRRQAAIRVRRSAPSPKSTTICACSLRAWVCPIRRRPVFPSKARQSARWLIASWRWKKARAFISSRPSFVAARASTRRAGGTSEEGLSARQGGRHLL